MATIDIDTRVLDTGITVGVLTRSQTRRPGVFGMSTTRTARQQPAPEAAKRRSVSEPPARRSLGPGFVGPDVKTLQVRLNARSDLFPPLITDGVFGYKTRSEVLLFQRAERLTPSGFVGTYEWLKLMRDQPGQKSRSRGSTVQPPIPEASLEERLGWIFEQGLSGDARGQLQRAIPEDDSRFGDVADTVSDAAFQVGGGIHRFDLQGLDAQAQSEFSQTMHDFSKLVVGAQSRTHLNEAALLLGKLLDLVGVNRFFDFASTYKKGTHGATEDETGAPEPPKPEKRRAAGRKDKDEDKDKEPEKVLSWIKFSLLDADGLALAGKSYRIKMPDGKVINGKIPDSGLVDYPKVPEGVCEVSFPGLGE